MKRSVAFVAVLGLFLLGIVIGALGMHVYDAHRPPHGPPFGASLRRGEPFGEHFAKHLERRLELTPGQLDAIHEILERSRQESREIREDVGPRVHDVMARAHEEILALLTPEQRERLEALAAEQPHRLERFLLGHRGRLHERDPERHPLAP